MGRQYPRFVGPQRFLQERSWRGLPHLLGVRSRRRGSAGKLRRPRRNAERSKRDRPLSFSRRLGAATQHVRQRRRGRSQRPLPRVVLRRPSACRASDLTARAMTTMAKSSKEAAAAASNEKLLDAAVHVIRSKGYSAARVEDICAEAGLTKGAFFHHFASKEACAVAAAAHFAARADAVFDAAPYTLLSDARARVLGYVDFRRAILQGELPQFTCLLGTMVQEADDTHPAIREACDRYISEHAERLEADLKQAKALYAPGAAWSEESAALFSQAVLQGSFVLAKAKSGPKVAADCLDHLERYFEALLPARA